MCGSSVITKRILGKRKRQSMILGDRGLLTTETQARKATQALLLRLNEESPRAEVEAASFGALLDRYIEQELSERYSTRKSHLSNIRVHIRPRWGEHPVDKLKPMSMEQWLRDLPLAPKSKTHVRGIMPGLQVRGAVGHCRTRQEPCLSGAREEWKQAAHAATSPRRGPVL
jgi:hypothetical protein